MKLTCCSDVFFPICHITLTSLDYRTQPMWLSRQCCPLLGCKISHCCGDEGMFPGEIGLKRLLEAGELGRTTLQANCIAVPVNFQDLSDPVHRSNTNICFRMGMG